MGPRNHRASSAGAYERIWRVVQRIPRGRVATYGQIARLAGFSGRARMTGYALHTLPPGLPVPWHRVINARGEISFPEGSEHHARQRRLLEREGVKFRAARIDLGLFGWKR